MGKITDEEHDQIMSEIGQPSKFEEKVYKRTWPKSLPTCDQELIWWEEMMEENPDIKKQSEDAYQDHCIRQAAEYFTHRILLRSFLEDHSFKDREHVLHGDFILHYVDKKVTIRSIVPNGKPFEFFL